MSSMVDGNSSSSHAADSLAESARMNAALPLGKKLKSRVHFTGCSRFNDRGDREPNVLYAEEGMVEEVLTEDGTSQRDMIVRVRFPFYVNASVIERYTECKLDEVRCSSAAPRHPLARRYLGTTRQPCTPALPLRTPYNKTLLSRVALRAAERREAASTAGRLRGGGSGVLHGVPRHRRWPRAPDRAWRHGHGDGAQRMWQPSRHARKNALQHRRTLVSLQRRFPGLEGVWSAACSWNAP